MGSSYVWSCYALTAIALLCLIVSTHRHFLRELRQALRRAESRRVVYLRDSHAILATLSASRSESQGAPRASGTEAAPGRPRRRPQG
jgi:heme exporter protein CcmD